MKKKKPIWKKWWLWLVILFVCLNILITNLSESEYDHEQERNELKEGNISTH
ncbi:hypothetical protein [Alkalihalobacterium sp. APHAB7]|uniref:hypothetical protein n=1 Tax=Alkalihalobacterium sp. APHAB7 TaxID=3402081 RepID=UPI003AADB974